MNQLDKMIQIKINGASIEVPSQATVLQACVMAGIEIPHFCYHPKLSIAGNCRMCLVEIKGTSTKPAASCALPVSPDMEIVTDSSMVKKARKGVLEFLLLNHPLDCPICDQGGECDLQDLTVFYGPGKSRFSENKRAVDDKDMGPLISTHMTRCIHCSRCVRFSKEITGAPELEFFGRGETTEIVPYLEHAVTSELSGNLIDICPVGALNSKPYAYKARSWELRSIESIDVSDAVGSHIRIDVRDLEVMRVGPRPCESINECWISDKARFSYDGLKNQRLDTPYIRKKNKLVAVSWQEALDYMQKSWSEIVGSQPDSAGILIGDLVDCETILAAKCLAESLHISTIDFRQQKKEIIPDKGREEYLFNTGIQAIESADACLIIGSNPRLEAPLINARLRKRYLKGSFPIGVVGPANLSLTYPYEHLGTTPDILNTILSEHHPWAKILKNSHNPIIIYGSSVYRHPEARVILDMLKAISIKFQVIRENWYGLNALQHQASRVGALDLNFYHPKGASILQYLRNKKLKFLYLIGADDIDIRSYREDTFIVYQGHHGDRSAQYADIIFPAPAFTEKEGTFVNVEGRMQKTQRALFPLGEAKEDWDIFCKVSKALGTSVPFASLQDVRKLLYQACPFYQNSEKLEKKALKRNIEKLKQISGGAFELPIENFYLTNSIARSSPTMHACTRKTTQPTKTNTGGFYGYRR